MTGLPPLIVPNTAVRRRFKPTLDGNLTISLPGETLLARVAGIADDDSVVVEIEHAPMLTGKSHNYRKGNFVPCRRAVDAMGVEVWSAVNENDLNQASAMQVLERTRPPDRSADHPATSDPTPIAVPSVKAQIAPAVPNAEAQIAPADPTLPKNWNWSA